jgi:hypothetical protein
VGIVLGHVWQLTALCNSLAPPRSQRLALSRSRRGSIIIQLALLCQANEARSGGTSRSRHVGLGVGLNGASHSRQLLIVEVKMRLRGAPDEQGRGSYVEVLASVGS